MSILKKSTLALGLGAAFALQACGGTPEEQAMEAAEIAYRHALDHTAIDEDFTKEDDLSADAISTQLNAQYPGLSPADDCLIERAVKSFKEREDALAQAKKYQERGFKGADKMEQPALTTVLNDTVSAIPVCKEKNPQGYTGNLTSPAGAQIIYNAVISYP